MHHREILIRTLFSYRCNYRTGFATWSTYIIGIRNIRVILLLINIIEYQSYYINYKLPLLLPFKLHRSIVQLRVIDCIYQSSKRKQCEFNPIPQKKSASTENRRSNSRVTYLTSRQAETTKNARLRMFSTGYYIVYLKYTMLKSRPKSTSLATDETRQKTQRFDRRTRRWLYVATAKRYLIGLTYDTSIICGRSGRNGAGE